MKKYVFILFLASQLCGVFSFAQENKKDAKGLKQGAWVKFDANTKAKLYEGSFVNDKPNGLFKYYFPSGKIKAITTYSNEGQKARALLFDEKGNKIAEGIYINEKKDSIWNYYNPEHVLISQESYLNCIKDGLWKIYYEDGKLFEETSWKAGVKNGIWKQYFKSGNPKTDASYKAGELDGVMKLFQPDGKLEMSGTYVNAMREGAWIYYLPSGEIKNRELYSKGTLLNQELMNGVFTDKYDNDILKSSYTYKDGKKNGEFIEYYRAGQWKKRLKPADGEFAEEEEEYFEGQKIQRKGIFVNDKLDGKISTFNLDGKLDKTEEYSNGMLISGSKGGKIK